MIPFSDNEPPGSLTLLASLRATATTKQRNGTLDRFVHACDALCAKGKNFTLRELEEYCLAVFGKGPNAQTISNDQGLRAYVEARRTEVGAKNSPRQRSALSHDIECVPDLTVRSRMRLLVEDYRLAQKRLRLLTESLSRLSPPLNLDDVLSGNSKSSRVQNYSVCTLPSNAEIVALKTVISNLMDDAPLRRAGLCVDEGDMVSRGLRETFIAGSDLKLVTELLVKLNKGNSQ